MLRSRSLLAASCALLLLFPGAVRAAASTAPKSPLPSEKEKWIQIETAHFTIFSNAPEKRALELGKSLERFRAVLAAFQTNLRLDPPQPNFIYIFKNQDSFDAYNLRVGGKPAAVSGLFHSGWDANYILMSAAWNEDPRPVIYHEFTHQFVRSNLSAVPAWFNEGLAEYFSTFVGDDRHASLGKPVPWHVQWLLMHPFMPIEELLEQQYNPDLYTEMTRQGTFYAQSWALVHYLLANGEERKGKAGKFLDGLRRGLSPEAAAQGAFQASLETLQQECKAYVAGGRFNYSEITFTDKFRVDERAKTRPMSRGESLTRLGELLHHLEEERLADAEAHLREALRLEPENGAALVAMGTIHASKGEFEQATPLFDRAAATRRDDPLLYYRRARALLHRKEGERAVGETAAAAATPETLTRARQFLARAIQIRPSFAEAYIELGNLADAPGGNLQEGIEALQKARALAPSRLDVTMNLFYLYLKTDNRAAAQDLFEKGIVPERDEEAIRWARLRLEYEDRVRAAAAGGEAATLLGEDAPAAPPEGAPAPPDEALFEKRKLSYVQVLEKALEGTTDPESRMRLEKEIARAKSQVNFPAQVDAFNQAVSLANTRDYKGSVAILEKLLPEVQDRELRARVESMLADLKKRLTQ